MNTRPTAGEEAPAAQTAAISPRHYRTLIARWYPAAWREAHGEVLLGTLLDVTESCSLARPTRGQHLDIAINGLREQLREATATAPRRIVASVAAGTLIAVVTVFFFTHLQPPRFTDVSSHVAIAAVFTALGLFVAGFLVRAHRTHAIVAMLLAASVTVWSAPAWAGPWTLDVSQPQGIAFNIDNLLPTVLANLGLLVALSALALIAAPEPRVTALSAIGTAPLVLLLASISPGPSLCGAFAQFHSGVQLTPSSVSAIVVPAVVVISLGFAAFFAATRRRTAAALTLLGLAPWAVGWAIALLVSPIVVIYEA